MGLPSSHSSPSGEIGRHSGLKIRRLLVRGRTGSIPVSGTKILHFRQLLTSDHSPLCGFYLSDGKYRNAISHLCIKIQ